MKKLFINILGSKKRVILFLLTIASLWLVSGITYPYADYGVWNENYNWTLSLIHYATLYIPSVVFVLVVLFAIFYSPVKWIIDKLK